jgi:hypothetical protein
MGVREVFHMEEKQYREEITGEAEKEVPAA